MEKRKETNKRNPRGEEEDEITQVLPEEEAIEGQQGRGDVSADLKDLASKLKETEDKYIRTYADFENYRRRVAREKEEVSQGVARRLLREFLEVKDHLEMALSHSEGATDVKGLREGVLLTLKQLNNFLEKTGITEVKSLGEPFNPNFHEAIQQVESVEYKPGVVVQVYQKGYLLQDHLLRPARVVVAATPSSKTFGKEESE